MIKVITFLQHTPVNDVQRLGANAAKLNFGLRRQTSAQSVVTGNAANSKLSPINVVIYSLARSLVAIIQILPLPLVARLGRAGGGLAFHLPESVLGDVEIMRAQEVRGSVLILLQFEHSVEYQHQRANV